MGKVNYGQAAGDRLGVNQGREGGAKKKKASSQKGGDQALW